MSLTQFGGSEKHVRHEHLGRCECWCCGGAMDAHTLGDVVSLRSGLSGGSGYRGAALHFVVAWVQNNGGLKQQVTEAHITQQLRRCNGSSCTTLPLATYWHCICCSWC